MKNITELMDCEKGNELIIIGGGPSVRKLYQIWPSYSRMKSGNQKIMVINFFHELLVPPDYNVYQDYNYKVYIEMGTIKIPDKTKLIALKEQVCYRTDYYFIQNEIIIPGTNSGFIGLQIADKILNPDKIYLIGYDYYMENDKIHYYDTYFNKFNDLEKHRYCSAFESMLNDYKKVKWNKDRIINLNPKSLLKL